MLINTMNKNKYVNLITPYALLLLVFHFISHDFQMSNQIPSNQDLIIGKDLLAKISQYKGEVFLTSSSYLNLFVGKNTHAHWITINEFTFTGIVSEEGQRLLRILREEIRDKKFDLVILDNEEYYDIGIDDSYFLDDVLEGDNFYPVTGGHYRPTYLYIPQNAH